MLDIIVTGISTILSPLIALWISESYIRKRNLEDISKREILLQLISNRYDVGSPEFIKAFNSVMLTWGMDDEVKRLIFEFNIAKTGDDKARLIVEIIHRVCIMEKILHLSRHDLLNIVKPSQ